MYYTGNMYISREIFFSLHPHQQVLILRALRIEQLCELREEVGQFVKEAFLTTPDFGKPDLLPSYMLLEEIDTLIVELAGRAA